MCPCTAQTWSADPCWEPGAIGLRPHLLRGEQCKLAGTECTHEPRPQLLFGSVAG